AVQRGQFFGRVGHGFHWHYCAAPAIPAPSPLSPDPGTPWGQVRLRNRRDDLVRAGTAPGDGSAAQSPGCDPLRTPKPSNSPVAAAHWTSSSVTWAPGGPFETHSTIPS